MKLRNIMKTKQLLWALPLLVLLGFTGRAEAVIGTVDNVPAATLLLPYFEVDLNSAAGTTTLFSINNASATAVLAHVTLWSDLAVPTLAFNVYLTGYDVQTFNLRDLFTTGLTVRTASAGQDPTDTISPKGMVSQDINFASCSGQLPSPSLPASYIAHLQASHTGNPSGIFSGKCAGAPYGDNIARGYVTVDTVNNCTLRVADQGGYLSGDITFQNVLYGDYFYINTALHLAEGDSLVSIESSLTNPITNTANEYTFYGRYDGWNASDHREPLNGTSAARFLNGGTFSGGTKLAVWRDTKMAQAPFTCGGSIPWYPLQQEDVYDFNEQETAERPSSTTAFPIATQRTTVNGPGSRMQVTPTFGWLYLNLNTTVPAAGSVPSGDPSAAQSWVGNTMAANGRFSVGQSAIALQNVASATHTCINGGGAPPCP